MTMPEAAMHETDSSEPREDQIRRPGELPVVKAVPESARMQSAAKDQLGFRVLPADSRHHSGPNRSINYVGHGLACIAWETWDRACIPQNIAGVTKKDGVMEERISEADFGHRNAFGNLPDCRVAGRSQHHARISQFAACDSLLLGSPPGKQHAKCHLSAHQP